MSERQYNGGDWTRSRFFSFIRSNLRRASMKWPPINGVLVSFRRPSQSNNPRLKWEYPCFLCGEWFPRKEVQVDHLEEVGSLRSFEDLPGFCSRLFCEEEGLAILCKGCHEAKKQARKEQV